MATKSRTYYYIHTAIGLALMLLFGLLPAPAPVTAVGMKVLGIFLGMLWLWVTVDGMWPSVLALLLIAFSGYLGEDVTGYARITTVFTTAFGNATIIMIILFTTLFSAIGDCGLAEQIASFLLRRKFIEGKPYVLLFMILLVSYILCGFGDFIVCLFIMWPVCTEICKKAGYEKGTPFWDVLMCAVFFGAAIGQPLLPFKGMVASLLATFAKMMPDYSIPLGSFLVFDMIMAVIVFLVYCLVTKVIIRPDVEGVKSLKAEELIEAKSAKLTSAQKIYGLIMIIMLLTVLLPNVFKGLKMLSSVGVIGMLAILMAVGMILKDENGKPIIDVRAGTRKNFNWSMIWQMVAAIYIAGALTSESTGIRTALTMLLKPALGGVPTIVFVILIVLFSVIITNFANNMVVGVIMVTLIGSFLGAMPGLNPAAATVMVIISVCIAFLLPSASVYAAILHSREDLLNMKSILRVFVPMIIAVVIVYCAIGYPIACIFFK